MLFSLVTVVRKCSASKWTSSF